jgi:hypothetical protein
MPLSVTGDLDQDLLPQPPPACRARSAAAKRRIHLRRLPGRTQQDCSRSEGAQCDCVSAPCLPSAPNALYDSDYIFFYSYIQVPPKEGGALWSDVDEMVRVGVPREPDSWAHVKAAKHTAPFQPSRGASCG